MYQYEAPIFVGLSGIAGSGKTSVASMIAPNKTINMAEPPPIVFDHMTLASPIYEIVGWKRNTHGADKQSRIMFGLHECIYELLKGHILYDDLIELVYDVYAMNAGTENDPKPRTFMQQIGDMMRSHWEDCFAQLLVDKAFLNLKKLRKEYEEVDYPSPLYFCLVSDVRRLNEFSVLNNVNSIMIRLETSKEVANTRVSNRDGVSMTPEQWNHPTETESSQIDYDLIVNTDNKTLEQVAGVVHNFIMEYASNIDNYMMKEIAYNG